MILNYKERVQINEAHCERAKKSGFTIKLSSSWDELLRSLVLSPEKEYVKLYS